MSAVPAPIGRRSRADLIRGSLFRGLLYFSVAVGFALLAWLLVDVFRRALPYLDTLLFTNVNSTDPSQAVKVGGTGKVTATYIGGPAAPNGFQATGSGIYSPAPVYKPAINDPLAALAQCTLSTCTSTARADVIINQNTTKTISPGVYSVIEASGDSKLTLSAGTYVVKKWMKIGQQASITGTGVTIYFVDCPRFYDRAGLYNENHADYPDNAQRFIFFSKCVGHLARYLAMRPEIVHAASPVRGWSVPLAGERPR